jgi:hypothetical protein
MLSSKIYGETMINLTSETMPSDNNSVGYTSSFEIGADIDERLDIKYENMIDMILHGNTMKNLCPTQKTTGNLTFTNHENIVPNTAPITIKDGEIVSGEIRGYTFENKVPMYGQSEQVTITGTVNIVDLIDNSANGICALDNQYRKPKKLFFVATMIEVTE